MKKEEPKHRKSFMKEELLKIIANLNEDDLRLLFIVALELKKEK